jgi:anti-sigma B factor antagonist
MKLNLRERDGTVVVKIRGKLIGGIQNSEEFRNVISTLLESGKRQVVVDLSATSWANSPGIGLLIGAYAALKKEGGELILCGVAGRMKDVLSVTRILLMFKTCDDVVEAVEYFQEKSKQGIHLHDTIRKPADIPPAIDEFAPYRFIADSIPPSN